MLQTRARNMECRVCLSIEEIISCLLRLENSDITSNCSSDDDEKSNRDEVRALREAVTLLRRIKASTQERNEGNNPATQYTALIVEICDKDPELPTSPAGKLTSS